MKQPTLKAKLQALGEAINELTDETVNFGGCCVYAALVARELEKLGIPSRGVVCDYVGGKNIDEARNHVGGNNHPDEWNRAGITFKHVGLEAEIDGRNYLIDSERIRPADERRLGAYGWPICDGHLSVDELEELAGLTGDAAETWGHDGWNSRFDRELIPDVREVVSRLSEEVVL